MKEESEIHIQKDKNIFPSTLRISKRLAHATWTNAVAEVYVNSVKRFLQTPQTFIFILLS